MSQQITSKALIEFKNQKGNDEIIYACQLPLKKITFSIIGNYRVYKNGINIYDGEQINYAVNLYNNI